jgi:thiol-disulfide isomerase/thioredoxin
LADVPRAAGAFEAAANLYKLVGTAAPPVTGQRWVNAPDSPASIKFGDGKVYLIQFTAHWCVPCRKSYPGLKAVHDQLAGQPFEILFETELYGNFAGKQATAEEEIAADKEYYKEHHGLPFRVAINPAPGANRAASVEGQFRVGGIPQTVVIDKKGMIRQIVVGGDKGNEMRLAALVRELLRER